jgi:hypothetical protein
MKQGAYVLFILLIIAFVLSGVFSSNKSIFPVVNWWNSLFNKDAATTTHSKSLSDTYDGVDTIQIDLVSADLVISKENVREIELSYSGNGELVVSEKGKTLTIKEEFKSWNLGSVSKGELILKIPNDLTKLETKVISGNTDISNLSFDKLNVESVSGRISISDIKADDLSIKSISGRIKVDNVNFLNGFMKNVSGRIDSEITDVWDSFSLETVSGRVSLDLSSKITPEISFSSVSGELTSSITGSDINCSIKVKTVSGDVKVSTR